MSDVGFLLKDADTWAELRPLSDRWAEVLRSNHWAPGDWVERPTWIDWEEAAELTVEGHSVLSPRQLSLVYDALADAFLFRSQDFPGRRFTGGRRPVAAPQDVEPFAWEIYVATA
jgi:hypothetical protein